MLIDRLRQIIGFFDLDQRAFRLQLGLQLAKSRFGPPRLITIDRSTLVAAKLPTVLLKYGIDDTIYAQGAPAQFVYVVDQGALCRFRLLHGGQKSILQFLFPGDGFGFGDGRYHLDTVQALTDTKVLAVGREALMDAATSNARLSKMLLTAAARALIAAEEQSVVLRGASSTERLALFLLDMDARLHGQINLPMSRTQIASYLGLTIETISRTFTGLKRAKIIQFRASKQRIDRQRLVVISDKQRLKQLAIDASDFDHWSTLRRPKLKDATTSAPAPTLQ